MIMAQILSSIDIFYECKRDKATPVGLADHAGGIMKKAMAFHCAPIEYL